MITAYVLAVSPTAEKIYRVLTAAGLRHSYSTFLPHVTITKPMEEAEEYKQFLQNVMLTSTANRPYCGGSSYLHKFTPHPFNKLISSK